MGPDCDSTRWIVAKPKLDLSADVLCVQPNNTRAALTDPDVYETTLFDILEGGGNQSA